MRDTKETIKCPACSSEMTKIFVKEANCYVDICTDGCGGIFFDNRELNKFDEQHENIDDILKAYKDKKYDKVNENSKRICPVCGGAMVKHYTSTNKEVEIDECYGCGGIFLDYGELEAIRGQFKTEKERQNDFLENFENQYSVKDFKDYKSKDVNEMYSRSRVRAINFIKHIL